MEHTRQEVELYRQELREQARKNGQQFLLDELRRLEVEVHGDPPLPAGNLAAAKLLLDWLPKVETETAKEIIVRALSVKYARPVAAVPLIAEFRKTLGMDNSPLPWAIGNAIGIVADESVYEQVVELVRDKRHGTARRMIFDALGRMKNPGAVDVAIESLDDEDVAGHAIGALGMLKSPKAKPHLERFLNHPTAWWRKGAISALARIEKAETKAREHAASAERKDPAKGSRRSSE